MSTDTIDQDETRIYPGDASEVAEASPEEARAIDGFEAEPEEPPFTPNADEPDPDADARVAVQLKLEELFEEQREGRRLLSAEEKAKLAHSEAKKAREVQDGRIKECIDELEALYRNEPDPDRYPLLDRKAEVDSMFPKPEAVAPLPPDDFDEALRRAQRDTRVAEMGLKPSTQKALEELGLHDAGAIVRRWNSLFEASSTPVSLQGITERRAEEIADALERITAATSASWDAAHPAGEGVADA